MASRIENPNGTKLDWLKWLVVSLLAIGGVVANYIYAQQPWPLRLLVGIFLIAMVVVIALQTAIGKELTVFARESRTELRKVSWPTRQQTVQMTLIIAGVVIILSLILWGIDGILLRVIGWLTGQRG